MNPVIGGTHMQKATLKTTPYGNPSFLAVRSEGAVYVDKTAFVEKLEQCGTKFPLIVRPRRFGKSLFANMLNYYYDKACEPLFEQLFGGTYIAGHKTPLAHQFYVFKLSFAGLASGDTVRNFQYEVLGAITDFLRRYPIEAAKEVLSRDFPSPAALLWFFFNAVKATTRNRVYVIIDEYDQFANELLANNPGAFRTITSSEGFLKDFYSKIKDAVNADIVDRVFITGVTTISLDSLTSGFGIQKNISAYPAFAAAFGFTESELKSVIPEVIDLKRYGHTLDEVFDRMKVLYDSYRFSQESAETVFNSSMCLYYLDAVAQLNHEPAVLMDPSFSQDLSKVRKILSMGNPEFADEIVQKSVRGQALEFDVLSQTINLNSKNELSNDDVLTVMYYFGYLTYNGEDSQTLVVPNRTVGQQFFEYYFKFCQGFDNLTLSHTRYEKGFAALRQGDARPFVEIVAKFLKKGSGLNKSLHLKESDWQTALLMIAQFDSDFDCGIEVEVAGENKGYADLFLSSRKPDAAPYSYLFEVKYLTKEKATDTAVSRALDDARDQVQRYAQGDNFAGAGQIKKVAVVFAGLDLAAFDQID